MIEDKKLKHYSGPWTEMQLKHLLRRTMFGVTNDDCTFFSEKSMDQCIDLLLADSPAQSPPKVNINGQEFPEGQSFVFESEDRKKEEGRVLYLKGWWVGIMLDQHRNISEKMVLFWRNHFVTEFNNVKDSRYLYQYLSLLRQYATGNFKKLTREITTNPAMLVYLNGNLNNKAAPNENYARELQELFSVGKGPGSHYTEADVKAAAKILSGWKDDKIKIGSYFDPSNHNTDDKIFSAFYNNHKIVGRTGSEGAKETDDLIEMICANKEVPRYICRKLYRWFVDCTIDEKVENNIIVPLADIMIQSNFEIKPVLKALFSSEFFYDQYLIGGMFKSPVDYVIGLLQEMKVKFSDQDMQLRYKQWWSVAVAMGWLGQDIGDPPGVAGWPAYYEYPIYYKNWVTSENLSMRNKLARLLIHPEESDGLFKFDFLGFVEGLSSPASSRSVLTDSLNLLCCIQPGADRITFLYELLDSEHNTQQKWTELWAIYKSDPAKDEIKEKITNRLKKIFDIVFTLPEFQIM